MRRGSTGSCNVSTATATVHCSKQKCCAARHAKRRNGDGQRLPVEPPHKKHLDIRYAEIEGVDPNLLSLDLYVPTGSGSTRACPILVMIHGGGWRRGDKAGPSIIGAKMRHFVGSGYIYASINYRLSPQTPQEGGIRHPVHAQDSAKALAWIHDHIAEYGGDPDQLHLMGHSAGGHLAAILGTNGRFLKAEGKDLSILKSNVLLDPAAIDIPGYLESVNERGMTLLYRLLSGATRRTGATPHRRITSRRAKASLQRCCFTPATG